TLNKGPWAYRGRRETPSFKSSSCPACATAQFQSCSSSFSAGKFLVSIVSWPALLLQKSGITRELAALTQGDPSTDEQDQNRMSFLYVVVCGRGLCLAVSGRQQPAHAAAANAARTALAVPAVTESRSATAGDANPAASGTVRTRSKPD